ncbi:MAG TPA: hypothetical protein VF921_00680 [Vicinamibacterales bacterium]
MVAASRASLWRGPAWRTSCGPEGLALADRTSGGRVFGADQSAARVAEMKTAFPARAQTRSMNPVRLP